MSDDKKLPLVFIGWHGKAKILAQALAEWLPLVINVRPGMSTHIAKGRPLFAQGPGAGS